MRSYQTKKTGVSKRTTAGCKQVKVIEWYFYPEFASRRLFKNKCVKENLKIVSGKHYDVLSQASNAWSQSSSVPVSNSAFDDTCSIGTASNFDYYNHTTPAKSIRSELTYKSGK